MEGVLCSASFRKFFSKVLNNGKTLNSFIKLISENISLVNKEISLGRLDFEVDDAFPLEELGCSSRFNTVFTEPYYNSAQKYEVRYQTHDLHVVTIILYPTS